MNLRIWTGCGIQSATRGWEVVPCGRAYWVRDVDEDSLDYVLELAAERVEWSVGTRREWIADYALVPDPLDPTSVELHLPRKNIMGLVKYRVTLEIVQPGHDSHPGTWPWDELIDAPVRTGAAMPDVEVVTVEEVDLDVCPRCDGTKEEPGAPYVDEDGMALCSLCEGRGR